MPDDPQDKPDGGGTGRELDFFLVCGSARV
jgi:hypothetical protein